MILTRWAWRPVRVTSGRWVWLAKYYEHIERYDKTTGRPPVDSYDFRWTETAAERTWRQLKESAIQNRNVWNDYNYTKEDKL
jgi:hypothetical protein